MSASGRILLIARNAGAHGDSFPFLARVSAYENAHGTPTHVVDDPR